MKVQIRDGDALRQVSPAKLRAYLETTDWALYEIWRERIAVWVKEKDGQTHQVLAPLSDHYDTYAMRIAEAVKTLAEVEERSQLFVYFDLMAAAVDTILSRPPEKGSIK